MGGNWLLRHTPNKSSYSASKTNRERERVSLPFILTEPDCGEVSPAELSDHMISSIVDIADVDDVVAPSAVIARVLLLFLVTAEHITLVVGV